MKTEIKLKNGNLSAYGFACGYVQKVENEKLHKQIFMEHSHFHVQSLRNNKPELSSYFIGGHIPHSFIIWEVFDNLKDAKKFYNLIK